MSPTPNLPPLPDYAFDDGADVDRTMIAYAQDAYQAGRLSGRAEYFGDAYRAGYTEALEQVKARIGAMQNREVK